MGLKPVYIKATTLPDAWFQVIDAILEHGRQWTVEKGSYEGQKRWELDYVSIHIVDPGARPLIPEMPLHLARIPPPTTMEYVEEYAARYLMSSELQKNEQYTYGSRLAGRLLKDVGEGNQLAVVDVPSQIDTVIARYKTGAFGTNQCSMSIAMPHDIHLPDPPCLRELDTRIFSVEALLEGEEPELHFFLYFRSWDAWNGFSANLAGVRLVQEYVAEMIGVKAGEMICSSKGLHVYDHAWDIAKLRVR